MRSQVIALLLSSSPCLWGFIPGKPHLSVRSRSSQRTISISGNKEDALMSWQEGVEKLLNPFDTNFGAKQIMLQDLLARREEVIKDVSDSIAAGRPEELLSKESPLREAATGVQVLLLSRFCKFCCSRSDHDPHFSNLTLFFCWVCPIFCPLPCQQQQPIRRCVGRWRRTFSRSWLKTGPASPPA